MTVLIDPPAWPAHGTLFSHLVSDSSLEELHDAAAAAGLPARAFDIDHYDVPAHRHADLVAAGAVPVSAGELVRRLVGSGLRVPARHRPRRLEPVLRRRWGRLFTSGTVPTTDAAAPARARRPDAPPRTVMTGEHRADAVRAVGEDLLSRWSEPHRSYHGPAHLLAVLEAVDLLEGHGEPLGPAPAAVRLATWFHDAVYVGDPSAPAGADEEASARLVEQALPGPGLALPVDVVAETARLVRLTSSHRPEPGDTAGAVLCDADLEVLGRSPEAYEVYRRQVRADFAHVGEEDWRRGRAAVLEHLLAADRLYTTATARRLWEEAARANLAAELAALH